MVELQNCCGSCVHYRQHYIKTGSRYSWVFCGRCVYRLQRKVLPDSKCCEQYKLRETKTPAKHSDSSLSS